MSPLQYHKRLRLYEAQRLMLAGEMDAGSAGLAVGYESTAQFNREYKRLFGEPPLRDLKRMRRHDACPTERRKTYCKARRNCVKKIPAFNGRIQRFLRYAHTEHRGVHPCLTLNESLKA